MTEDLIPVAAAAAAERSRTDLLRNPPLVDPDLDPPENFVPGGNRLATVLVYLQNAADGGETFFPKLGLKLKPQAGDALLFYDLLPNGKIDKMSVHTGTPPSDGEKWVATKWSKLQPR